MKRTLTDELRCSFCQKNQDVVGKLISSPSNYPRAYICDECIGVCNSVLEADKIDQPSPAASEAAKPLDVKEVLDQYSVAHDDAIDVSDDLYRRVQEIAAAQKVSFSEVIAAALTEYLAARDRLKG